MALALGAKGVGLGRPFLFAQAAYGEKGVIRAVRSELPPYPCRWLKLMTSTGTGDRYGDAADGSYEVG